MNINRKLSLDGVQEGIPQLKREWLTTNGMGGYASATVSGGLSRRYHGLLVAAMPAPLGRVVMLNHVEEILRLPDGRKIPLQPDDQENIGYLKGFDLEYRMPIWTFQYEGIVISKRLVVVHCQNTVQITYKLVSGSDQVGIELHPSIQFRQQEKETNEAPLRYRLSLEGSRFEIVASESNFPPLRLLLQGQVKGFMHTGPETREVIYPIEGERGYACRGFLWNSGYFVCDLRTNHDVNLIASTENWDVIDALQPATAYELEVERCQHLIYLGKCQANERSKADLVLAADQFIITPAGRVEDGARARAVGDEIRTIIAGYHWFTDWGRDTMISLEGLTLSTGRVAEAEWILRTFAHYVKDGLIPNMFPEGKNAGLYHTADATLWFFHAVDRYVETTNDRRTLSYVLPHLRDVIEHHIKGTLFHIGMDKADGLLSQGEKGYQLTWMDAKMEDWVVTPRRGKAVEINALWYNALRLMETWLREEGEKADAIRFQDIGDRVLDSFNKKFWNEPRGHLFDIIDGEDGKDPACRPNQILSFSLKHPVLANDRWSTVLNVVTDELLTPYGLRSLSPKHPDYKPRYFGDLRSRDAAYHQGTVWAWLIGPYIDAYLKVNPECRNEARKMLLPLVEHMNANGIGSISEVFDAEAPYTPRGCIAQAWSVAEVLRCWLKTEV